MSEAEILARVEGAVGRITLNRPKALHALNTAMCTQMSAALIGFAEDPKVAFVLLDHAEGTRGFCAGGDIRLLAESGRGDGAAADAFFRVEYRLNHQISMFPKPYVAVLDGITMGGGFGVSVHGSHRIATEATVFAMPETAIGLIPDVGGGYVLPRLAGEIGMWLALTGLRLKGADVVQGGIATHFVPGPVLPAMKSALLAASSADGVEAVLPEFTTPPAAASFAPQRGLIDHCFGGDSVEDILARLGAQDDPWAAATHADLLTKSPQALKVTFRQMREGRALASLAEALEREFRIASRCVRRHDFAEGVRALIIDKDNAPRWNPTKLEDVSADLLDSIFAPLPESEMWTPLASAVPGNSRQ